MTDQRDNAAERLRRVLVVEDEPRLRQMLARVLNELGYDATVVASGEEAVSLMGRDPHPIAMVDLNLPGMDGIACLTALRQQAASFEAIILTGYGDLDAARRAIHLEVVDFLTKPARMEELDQALSRALGRLLERTGPTIDPRALTEEDSGAASATDAASSARSLGDLERQAILDALARHDGNRQKTAEELGISVRTLYYRLVEYEKQGYLRRGTL